jgi:hypothetical protein
MNEVRKETDSLGVVEVPADKLWGAQTHACAEDWLPLAKLPQRIWSAQDRLQPLFPLERKAFGKRYSNASPVHAIRPNKLHWIAAM